jgi:hypothetical protein
VSADAGADASADAGADASADADANATASATRIRGPLGIFLRAARDLSLDDAQRASYEALLARAANDGGLSAELDALEADIVAGATGALSARYAKIDAMLAARRDAQAIALNDLHALLRPPQRVLVVEALRAKRAMERQREHAREARESDEARAKRRLDETARALDLDDAQKKALTAIFAKGPTHDTIEDAEKSFAKKLDALLSAFASDRFDARPLAIPLGLGKTPYDALKWRADLFDALARIVRTDQRPKLAALAKQSSTQAFGLPLGETVEEEDD